MELSAFAYPDNPPTKCPILIHVGGPFLCYMCSYEKQPNSMKLFLESKDKQLRMARAIKLRK